MKFFRLLAMSLVLASTFLPGGANIAGSPIRADQITQPCPAFNFVQTTDLSSGAGPTGAAVADFDADGKLDVAVSFTSATNGFSIIRNLGGRNFAPRIDFFFPFASGVMHAVFANDIDGDGRPDIVVTTTFAARIFVFRNTSSGPGQISFAQFTEYVTASNRSRVVVFADFDGDGKIDIGSGNQENSSVSVFRNLSSPGAVVLAAKVDFSTGNGSNQLTVADFDGDGKSDIGVGGSGTFKVLRNTSSGQGDLNFVLSSSFTFSSLSTGVSAGDLDLDGKPDVAISSENGRTVAVLRNISSSAGDINFAPRINLVTGAFPVAVKISDFDLDGKPEIAVANSGGEPSSSSNKFVSSVTVYRNIGTPGTLNFSLLDADFGVGRAPRALVVADVDGDGKSDLTTANIAADTASIAFNSSTGNGSIDFISRKDYFNPLSTDRSVPTNTEKGDFDLDGDIDIVTSYPDNDNASRVTIFSNDGNGRLSRRNVVPLSAPGVTNIEPVYVSAADLDGDGKLDLAALASWSTLNGSAKGLLTFRNVSTGPENFAFQAIDSGREFPTLRSLVTTDLDSDGKSDVIVIIPDFLTPNSFAEIFRNTSTGPGSVSFADVTELMIGDPATTQPIVAADFNADSKTDLGYPNRTTGLTIQINTGTGPGQIAFSQQDVTAPSWPTLLDADGDGKLDLASGGPNTTGFVVYLNTSSGGQVILAAPVAFADQPAATKDGSDMDADGKADLIATALYGNLGYIFRNQSAGGGSVNFPTWVEFTHGRSLDRVLTADLNGDGKKDVVAGLTVLLTANCRSANGAPFDFDGDGKTDIGIFRPIAGASEWWVNRSSTGQTFALQFGASTDRITPADYTGDGKADIAFFRPASGEWYVLRSEDLSFFALPFGTNGDVPVPADYDADGKADFAVFRPSSSTWFISQSSGAPTRIFQFGLTGDQPVVADYDGDGRADVGIFRQAAGGAEWWIQRSTAGSLALQFGANTDKAVQGDYTGDGKADIAIWKPSTGEWFIVRSEDFSFYGFPFGASSDIPAPGDYDGDGKFDATVFRPSSATWFIARSTAGTQIVQFGATGDQPIPNAFVR